MIEHKGIKIKVDSEGNIWVYEDRRGVYFKIYNNGDFTQKKKHDFEKSLRGVTLSESQNRGFPESIIALGKNGAAIKLDYRDLSARAGKYRSYFMYPPIINIKFVIFDYDSVIVNMLKNSTTAEVSKFFTDLEEMGLKVIISGNNLQNAIYPGVAYESEEDILDNRQNRNAAEIMYIGAGLSPRMRGKGIYSVAISGQYYMPVSEVMNREVDAVGINFKKPIEFLGLIEKCMVQPIRKNGLTMRQVIEKYSFDLKARNSIANVLAEAGDGYSAIDICLGSVRFIALTRERSWMFGLISNKNFLDTEESITLNIISKAYLKMCEFESSIQAARNALGKYPKEPSCVCSLMTAYLNSGLIDRAIQIGIDKAAEIPGLKFYEIFVDILQSAYLERAVKGMMMGMDAPIYTEDFKRAKSLKTNRRQEYLRQMLAHADTNSHRPDYALWPDVLAHIVRRHTVTGSEVDTKESPLFPDNFDQDSIVRIVKEAAEKGICFHGILPFWEDGTIFWYTDGSDFADSGIDSIIVETQNDQIATAVPITGNNIKRRARHKKDIKDVPISMPARFLWNLDTGNRIRSITNKIDFEKIISNDQVFGNMPRIYRHLAILLTIWKGEFKGTRYDLDKDRALEIYEYTIPKSIYKQYNALKNLTLQVYIDAKSRRLVGVGLGKPEPEKVATFKKPPEPEKIQVNRADEKAIPIVEIKVKLDKNGKSGLRKIILDLFRKNKIKKGANLSDNDLDLLFNIIEDFNAPKDLIKSNIHNLAGFETREMEIIIEAVLSFKKILNHALDRQNSHSL